MKPDERRIAYDGKLIDLVIERWGEHEREIVEHPGSVAVVAIDRGGRVVLVRQLREAARTMLLELPAGTMEAGEDPIVTAQRELREETGYGKGAWRRLGAVWTSPGFLRERMHLFLAEDVEPGAAEPDADEEVEVVLVPFAEAVAGAAELDDAKTVAGLLLASAART